MTELIRQRREATRISQDDLAWIVRVSRNTVSNLERGQGQPHAQTLSDVCTALGLDWGRLTAFLNNEDGDGFPELLPGPGVRRIFEITKMVRDRAQSHGRQLADIYMQFAKAVAGADDPWGTSDPAERQQAFQALCGRLIPWMSRHDPIDDPVIQLFRDFEWSPEDTPASNFGRALSQEKVEDKTLPANTGLGLSDDVTELLTRGQIIDYEVFTPKEGTNMSVVALAVRRGPAPLSVVDRQFFVNLWGALEELLERHGNETGPPSDQDDADDSDEPPF